MRLKLILAKKFSQIVASKVQKWKKKPLYFQEQTLKYLLKNGKGTTFGIENNFAEIKNYEDFKQRVPLCDYEDLKPYIGKIKAGMQNVLWPGKPSYFAKTSGTTSGTKYIPISKSTIKNQVKAARNALLMYIHETGNANFVNGKMIFLQGSPEMHQVNGIQIGRLSGIVAHYVPKYLQSNRLPSFETNCIEDWEVKVDAIVEETFYENMTLISGIPPWLQMYFNKLSQKAEGKLVKDIFKNFSLMVYGGVNYEPYRAKMEATIGKKIDSIETYPASEGFIAFQDSQKEEGMLLLVDGGIYYEFIAVDTFYQQNPIRINLAQVQLGVNYAIVLNTDSGLWGYCIGDTVRFTSLYPHKIVVTGRIKHFISAFGEHVIGEEVEYALQKALENTTFEISEFTVAPQVSPVDGCLPHHEWLIEFENAPENLEALARSIDTFLQEKNSYYKDLIQGNVLQTLKIKVLRKNAFIDYMKSIGKLGGQNKVPRLSNDRIIADALYELENKNDFKSN